MEEKTEKIPNIKEIEKEIGEFLNKKFGGAVKVITPAMITQETQEKTPGTGRISGSVHHPAGHGQIRSCNQNLYTFQPYQAS
jgi:hypothetical protein